MGAGSKGRSTYHISALSDGGGYCCAQDYFPRCSRVSQRATFGWEQLQSHPEQRRQLGSRTYMRSGPEWVPPLSRAEEPLRRYKSNDWQTQETYFFTSLDVVTII